MKITQAKDLNDLIRFDHKTSKISRTTCLVISKEILIKKWRFIPFGEAHISLCNEVEQSIQNENNLFGFLQSDTKISELMRKNWSNIDEDLTSKEIANNILIFFNWKNHGIFDIVKETVRMTFSPANKFGPQFKPSFYDFAIKLNMQILLLKEKEIYNNVLNDLYFYTQTK